MKSKRLKKSIRRPKKSRRVKSRRKSRKSRKHDGAKSGCKKMGFSTVSD